MTAKQWEDLTPYTASAADLALGLTPLAVGWRSRGGRFKTGKSSAEFHEKLRLFCQVGYTIDGSGTTHRCFSESCPRRLDPLGTGEEIVLLTQGEIRVIGETDIYAAPTIIYHYVTEHLYQPPAAFVKAVLNGPQPGSAEHRLLIKSLESVRR